MERSNCLGNARVIGPMIRPNWLDGNNVEKHFRVKDLQKLRLKVEEFSFRFCKILPARSD